MLKRLSDGLGFEFPFSPLDFVSFDVFTAQSREDVRSLVCIQEGKRAAGSYSVFRVEPDGKALTPTGDAIQAYAWRWDVRLVDWPTGRVRAAVRLDGNSPAPYMGTRYARPKDEMGPQPSAALWNWLAQHLVWPPDEILVGEVFDRLWFSGDGTSFAGRSVVGERISVWDTRAKRVRCKIVFTSERPRVIVENLAFLPGGKVLALVEFYGDRDRTELQVRGGQSGELLRTAATFPLLDHRSLLGVSPDGAMVAMASEGSHPSLQGYRNVELLNLETGDVVWRFPRNIHDLVFSAEDGKLICALEGGVLEVWKIGSNAPAGVVKMQPWNEGLLICPARLSRNGRVLATLTTSLLTLWDTQSGAQLRKFNIHAEWRSELAVSPDGRFVSFCADENAVTVWDVSTGRPVSGLNGFGMAFSSDGQTLAVSRKDALLKLVRLGR